MDGVDGRASLDQKRREHGKTCEIVPLLSMPLLTDFFLFTSVHHDFQLSNGSFMYCLSFHFGGADSPQGKRKIQDIP